MIAKALSTRYPPCKGTAGIEPRQTAGVPTSQGRRGTTLCRLDYKPRHSTIPVLGCALPSVCPHLCFVWCEGTRPRHQILAPHSGHTPIQELRSSSTIALTDVTGTLYHQAFHLRETIARYAKCSQWIRLGAAYGRLNYSRQTVGHAERAS